MIKNRNDIPKLLKKLNVKIGVELGVAAGQYSQVLNNFHTFEKFFCIDKWNDHHNELEKLKVQNMFKDDRNVIIMHSTFSEALAKFDDSFFDFIYIDGYAHTGQDGGSTLREWFPKLKNGGIFAGHDYCKSRFPKTYNNVNLFLRDNLGYKIHTTGENVFPSWYIKK